MTLRSYKGFSFPESQVREIEKIIFSSLGMEGLQGSAVGVPVVVLSGSRTGQMFGTGVAEAMCRGVLPPGAVTPGCTINIKCTLGRYSPFNGGGALEFVFSQGANRVVVATLSVGATLGILPLEQEFTLTGNRKWAYPKSSAGNLFFDSAAPGAGTYSLNKIINSTAPGTKNPTSTTLVPFVTYSAPPVVESTLIDFNQPVTFTIEATVVAGDCVEVTNFTVQITNQASVGINNSHVKSTVGPGDSLMAGTGSTGVNNDPLTQFSALRPGRPVLQLGMGGQTATTIANRVIQDPVANKYWDMIIWVGANDINGSPAANVASVAAAINKILAFRAPGAKTIITNLHPNSTWIGTANETAMLAVNAYLLATYGVLVADIYTPLTAGFAPSGNPAYYADVGHLNNAGYAIVAGVWHAKATTLSWA